MASRLNILIQSRVRRHGPERVPAKRWRSCGGIISVPSAYGSRSWADRGGYEPVGQHASGLSIQGKVCPARRVARPPSR